MFSKSCCLPFCYCWEFWSYLVQKVIINCLFFNCWNYSLKSKPYAISFFIICAHISATGLGNLTWFCLWNVKFRTFISWNQSVFHAVSRVSQVSTFNSKRKPVVSKRSSINNLELHYTNGSEPPLLFLKVFLCLFNFPW